MNKPDWCPHLLDSQCILMAQSQNKACIGKLPHPEPHDNDFNDHRLCLDTRETGHGIFDLQINWTDSWNLIRLLKLIKKDLK